MRLLLIAGFLGSGKTTLTINLARAAVARGKKVAILVNEIGAIGIDNQLMRQLELNVFQLFGGCICCSLAGDLVSSLQQLDTAYDPDLVMVEPSGAAEPGNILNALPYYDGRPLDNITTLALLDPTRLSELYEVLTPLITRQAQGADWLVVTKADLAQPEEVEVAVRIATGINPRARLVKVDARAPLDQALVEEWVG
ncbi:MAG: putative metal chaperone YciC [Chloroflexi bacterium ADurb.Bin180]|nr:MAG: putative metal chaperone YciC [Chloroflexi bacterium ADurb.Bin180]